jgi:cysteine desulfurase
MTFNNNAIIYFDNNSTTPLDKRVLEIMMPFLTEVFSNSSSNHSFGKESQKAVENSQKKIAELIGAQSSEILFTSGATESINLAIKGVAEANRAKKHIITVSTEHSAVLDVCRYLETKGYEITYLPVKNDGLVELELLRAELRPDTLLVSVMLVNNETGVIQPIKEIAEMAHEHGALVMTDATQAIGKMPVSVNDLNVDLMPFSAHKFYGPKGIGCLFFNRSRIKSNGIIAQIQGGGHQSGLRSGTLNVPGIVGMGAAAELAAKEMSQDELRIRQFRDTLDNALLEIPGTFVNGHKTKRLYNVTNICFPGIDADVLIPLLNPVMVSNGSACTSAIVEPSYVLKAMGLSDANAFASIRLSLGRMNTQLEIERAVLKIKEITTSLHYKSN